MAKLKQISYPTINDEEWMFTTWLGENGNIIGQDKIINRPAPPSTYISSRELYDRFTHAEKVALKNAAKTDDNADICRDDLMNSGLYLDKTDATVIANMDNLVTLAVITLERKAEILA